MLDGVSLGMSGVSVDHGHRPEQGIVHGLPCFCGHATQTPKKESVKHVIVCATLPCTGNTKNTVLQTEFRAKGDDVQTGIVAWGRNILEIVPDQRN